ncbi:MAG TPA: FAD-binding oxidoreductase [Candidatus Limiplasma sp.]|nr:FAD-binding oxidoreductase [Candidatus Limiplasma sp.]
MTLSNEIYQALEAIVGKRNISRNLGVRESYRNVPAQSSAHYGPSEHWTPLPQAVVLPGNTEEVQGVIRICNKYGIEFKASTTFWSTMGYIGGDFAIQMDTRRMKSVTIDQKNMTAIIEPFAIGATVQAEAMKYGLNLNIPGVGCSSSTLANFSSWAAFGPNSISMGAGSENMLGVEWVLPSGEVMRTGSWGAGDGWFCGEGPGPSQRGLLRGIFGAAGTFGVCTKMAVRLHPWPGPKVLPTYGTVPAYKANLGDNFKCYTLCFPNWEAWARSTQYFYECDVLYTGHRQFNMFGRDLKAFMLKIITNPDAQLGDLPKLMEDPYLQEQNKSMKLEYQVIIAGITERDMAYKEAAVDYILKETGGWKNEMMLEKDMHDSALLYLTRLGHKNLNYVMCGAYEGTFGLTGNVWKAIEVAEEAAGMKKHWEQTYTHIAATGGDSSMGGVSSIGGGGSTGWEFFTNFDAYDKESVRGTAKFVDGNQQMHNKYAFGPDFCRWNSDVRHMDGYSYTQEEHNEMFSKAPQPWVFAYQYKIREAINPNNLCGTYVRTLDPSTLEKA